MLLPTDFDLGAASATSISLLVLGATVGASFIYVRPSALSLPILNPQHSSHYTDPRPLNIPPHLPPAIQIPRTPHRKTHRLAPSLPRLPRRPPLGALALAREIRYVHPSPFPTFHTPHFSPPLSRQSLRREIGPIIRFGPNSLSVNTATGLHSIYGFHSNVQKSRFYSAFPPTKDTFNTHSSIDKHAHSRKRRVLSHAFSDTAVKAMERYILQNVRAFTDGLGGGPKASDEKKGWGVAQNMADWANYLTFDVMGDLCFGKAFGMLERADNRFAINLIGNAAHRHLIVGPPAPTP